MKISCPKFLNSRNWLLTKRRHLMKGKSNLILEPLILKCKFRCCCWKIKSWNRNQLKWNILARQKVYKCKKSIKICKATTRSSLQNLLKQFLFWLTTQSNPLRQTLTLLLAKLQSDQHLLNFPSILRWIIRLNSQSKITVWGCRERKWRRHRSRYWSSPMRNPKSSSQKLPHPLLQCIFLITSRSNTIPDLKVFSCMMSKLWKQANISKQ